MIDWVKFEKNNTLLLPTPKQSCSPLDAALFTIQHIVSNYPAPYTLMVSGGVDSQAMLWAWHKSGVPYTAVSGRYNGGLNDHDLVELKRFTRMFGIPIEYRDIDVLSFLDTEYPSWAEKYQCSSPQICTHMKIASGVDCGTVIFSGNFVTHGDVALGTAVLGMYRYGQTSGQSIVPYFLMETPELAYAFDPYIPPIPHSDQHGVYLNKVETYHKAGFPVVAQCEKFTGFEKIKDGYDISHISLITKSMRLTYASMPSKRTFDLLLRYPYEDRFGADEKVVIKFC